MYSYDDFVIQSQQQLQGSQQTSRPSPPQSTCVGPQSHTSYYSMPPSPMVGSIEDYGHSTTRTNTYSSQSPAVSSSTFSNLMLAPGSLIGPDYLHGGLSRNSWGQKPCEESELFPLLDPDVPDFYYGIIDSDENTPTFDPRQCYDVNQRDTDNMTFFNMQSSRRMSGSSYSMSSTGGIPEMSSYGDVDSPETVSYASDRNVWRNLEPTTNHLMSPISSSHISHHDNVIRGGSRSRGSPASHTNVRSSPYSLESPRLKRWSTGQAPTSTPTSSSSTAQTPNRFALFGPRLTSHHSMPAYGSTAPGVFGPPTQKILYSHDHTIQSNTSPLVTPPEQPFSLEFPPLLPSQGLFRLPSNDVDRQRGSSSHYSDLSGPPDLFASLYEQPSNPPESDMNPSDPDLVPHEQDTRFTGDLYTPRWVRGHGNKREGWCGLCKPGRWLVLKNSAFWYDKSFTHGVSAATGAAFKGPHDTRRTEGNLDVWEGLCGSCGDWIALVSSKKKGTTWFRHAYKCHTHPKLKDGPKRRRETQAGRVRATSSASATSSSDPVKRETSQTSTPPIAIPGSTTLQSSGVPITSAPPVPVSTPQLTISPPSKITSYPSSLSCPTPTSGTPTMQSYHTPASNTMYQPYTSTATYTMHDVRQPTFTSSYHPPYTPTATSSMQRLHTPTVTSFQKSPIVGFFNTPMHVVNTESACSTSLGFSHQISEPETLGIRTSTAGLNSIASMI
ncbi:hypothetical protein P153DRAFT_389105 [Dothidotthia symphoricarpi CBS 119687]|uniref:Transcription regulator Rua1 C-terminal domain-containing protein n=1 Tax=Dothidotthia symphoricarpi CBS 119687 TaxID=1392245 RepID=A0A6A6A4X5_9PLEO|nr:uncharacterized protein P153DRAFT_389105 [Dothidotthia symphoricarpi CBS 119687]KAF2125651.1 hypothetical protein P153DRAFT_389105 [Dothidotthia symphoricarpi CBS 119687]